VAAVQIEDQAWSKKGDHETGKRLVDTQEMVGRLSAALDVRYDANLVVIARTDALAI
jgi:methylisocitrate lyase